MDKINTYTEKTPEAEVVSSIIDELNEIILGANRLILKCVEIREQIRKEKQ